MGTTCESFNFERLISSFKIQAFPSLTAPTVGVSSIETDYLGMVNFCLRSSDTALSGPSRSKVLNAMTNNVYRAIMIGNPEFINQLIQKIGHYREKVAQSVCILGAEDGNLTSPKEKEVACTQDLLLAYIYIDSLEKLLSKGQINSVAIGGIYDKGYKLLLTTLRNGGCNFLENSNSCPQPSNINICLSIVDSYLPADTKTITKELNTFSNWVMRAMVFGEERDRIKLAHYIYDSIPYFIKRYSLHEPKDIYLVDEKEAKSSQEILYLKALILLLREGIEAAEGAITYSELSSPQIGVSNISGNLTELSVLNEPPLRLYDTYHIAFQRVVSTCLKEYSSRSISVPVDPVLLQTLSLWEAALRTNLTAKLWQDNPPELVGVWELVDLDGRDGYGFIESGVLTSSPSGGINFNVNGASEKVRIWVGL